ncbi:MAG: Ig-like domain-containing protein [Clostridiales bacterium]|nr:Ig-like domain-containing protein [Clostridiales bacterium]
MKRLIPLLLTVLVLLCGLSGAALAENQFHFDKTINTVFEGEDLQLVLVRDGDCAQDGELTYKTNAKSIATVDENGVLSGLSKGEVTVTATLKGAKRSWTATMVVTVQRRVTDIQLTNTNLKIYDAWDPIVDGALNPNFEDPTMPVLLLRKGKTVTIGATCTPSTASNRRWKMTTSDDSIARVSGTELTGRSPGECVVTIASVLNPEVRKEYRVLVVSPVTRVRVTGDAKTLYLNETLMLQAEVTPADATIRQVVWTSDRPDNATVDAYGVVTGVSKGSAVITAKAADGSGCYGSFTVTVRQQPEEITLNKTDITLKADNYVTITPTVLPASVNDKSVTWSSSDASVAKVSTAGRVTAVSPGTAIITCQSKTHPDVYAQAIVHVYQPVTKITFTDKNPYVAVGETIHLGWMVSPTTATDSSVSFSTNKENVVRVGQDGSVTGLKRGECYVYATANDGSGKKATIKVQVTQPVEGVSIKYDERTVGVGEKTTNTAVFYPEDASITKMQWYAEDATIASVSGTGSKVTVTGQRWGETTILGVTDDGSYVTSFTVKVGDENKPLKIVQLYVENEDTIRIQVYNQSDMTITRFYYIIETYDAWGNPIVCNWDGRSNDFEGYYGYTLEPGDATRHGRFTFGEEFIRPSGVAMVTMRITAYRTDDGNTCYIPRANQVKTEWRVKVLGSEEY